MIQTLRKLEKYFLNDKACLQNSIANVVFTISIQYGILEGLEVLASAFWQETELTL